MKLVKRSLLINNQIRFVTDLAVGEDEEGNKQEVKEKYFCIVATKARPLDIK